MWCSVEQQSIEQHDFGGLMIMEALSFVRVGGMGDGFDIVSFPSHDPQRSGNSVDCVVLSTALLTPAEVYEFVPSNVDAARPSLELRIVVEQSHHEISIFKHYRACTIVNLRLEQRSIAYKSIKRD